MPGPGLAQPCIGVGSGPRPWAGRVLSPASWTAWHSAERPRPRPSKLVRRQGAPGVHRESPPSSFFLQQILLTQARLARPPVQWFKYGGLPATGKWAGPRVQSRLHCTSCLQDGDTDGLMAVKTSGHTQPPSGSHPSAFQVVLGDTSSQGLGPPLSKVKDALQVTVASQSRLSLGRTGHPRCGRADNLVRAGEGEGPLPHGHPDHCPSP